MNEALTGILLVSDGAVGNYDAPLAILKGRVDRTDPLQRALADASNYNHKGRQTEHREPTSSLANTIDHLDLLFRSCRTHRQRLMVIKKAQDLDTQLRYAPNRCKVPGTKEWEEAIADDPRTSGAVAVAFKTSQSRVKRIKKKAGTSGPRGKPKRTTS
jgi:hypothetical protein